MIQENTHFKVKHFRYDGMFVTPLEGFANYTAIFKKWTNDPGITLCECSDKTERLIPSCCLVGNVKLLPKQDFSNKVLFGKPSTSC